MQSDVFADLESVALCGFTTVDIDRFPRVLVMPTPKNGLNGRSWVMVDKVVTMRRERVGERLGEMEAEDMERLDRALLVFLGLVD